MDKLPLEQFFQENEKLIHFASQKASRRFAAAGLADHFDYDEIHGQLREVFIKSYHGFDPERAKFSTYFVTAATNAVTNEIERLYRYEMKTISGSQSHTGEDSEGEWFDSFADESSSAEEEVELLHAYHNAVTIRCRLDDYRVAVDWMTTQSAHRKSSYILHNCLI